MCSMNESLWLHSIFSKKSVSFKAISTDLFHISVLIIAVPMFLSSLRITKSGYLYFKRINEDRSYCDMFGFLTNTMLSTSAKYSNIPFILFSNGTSSGYSSYLLWSTQLSFFFLM
eukprot:764809_1